ncbi:hypothetical protein ABW19_dt0200846 [Dactylella cylindrospora]|nr:hypothetical protein ABW19_dt0200846 [Dactylella cylindrospora]
MKASVLVSSLAVAASAFAAVCNTSTGTDLAPYIEQLSQGGGGGGNVDPEILEHILDQAVSTSVKNRLVRRDDLDCGSSTCYFYQDYPLCFNAADFTWFDAAGNSGNLADGSYTLADGRKGNLYTGPYPYPGDDSSSTTAPPSATVTPAESSSPATTSETVATSTSTSTTDSTDATETEASSSDAPAATTTAAAPNGASSFGVNLGLSIVGLGAALFLL